MKTLKSLYFSVSRSLPRRDFKIRQLSPSAALIAAGLSCHIKALLLKKPLQLIVVPPNLTIFSNLR